MHKHTQVAELVIDNETGFIQKIGKIHAPEHLPVGVGVKKGVADRAALNIWWTDRAIPASRSGVREALETLQITNTKMLLIRCFGLSLSDQYWICPENSDLTWEKVNFFENEFSDDIGDVLFGADKKPDQLNFSSPDNTSDGNLKKRWKIIDCKRCLIKGGSNPYRQQPLNEVIASEIMRRLNIPHVSYTVTWNKGAPYSVCEDFIDENTELIPAWRIIQIRKQPNNMSLYQHLIECADELGIPDVRQFLDRMIVLDYIIANEDRHLNNFGAIRNVETLEWLGMAPIYDSGSSLGYDKSAAMMYDESEVICKPFKKHHTEQLKLVSSFDWIDFSALADVSDMITKILSDKNAKDYMEENRIRVIAELTKRRIKNLETLANSKTHRQNITTDDEVGENVAAEYHSQS
ncbi:MAG: HipA domain-containing protein [Clostridiales bacterium]|nr:HipA domain-containing protein [Clostridiales bacterium]